MTQTAAKPKTEDRSLTKEAFTTEEAVFREATIVSDSDDRLVHWLSLVWRSRRVIGKAGMAGLVAGAILALLIPTRYTSTVRLMPPDNQSSSGMALLAALTNKAGGGGLGALAGDLMGVKSSGALFVGILRSETVEDNIVGKFDLQKVYGAGLEEDARKKLDSRTVIAEDRKSGIITISVDDHSPQRAAAMAESYVEQLNNLVVQLSTSSAHREHVFLEERLAKVKEELDQASRDFSDFASKNKTIDIKEEARAMLQGAASLEGELIATQSELSGMQAIYTDNNARVKALKARVDELRNQLNKLGGNNTGSGPAAAANSADTSTFPSIKNLPLLGVRYADLYRHVQIEEAVFETLTRENELAKVQEAKETPSVKVLDAPKIPQRKSYPPRTLIALLCSLVGCICAALWVIAQARWNEIDPRNPGKVLAVDVIHTIDAKMPWAPPNGSRIQAAMHRGWLGLRALQGPKDEQEGKPDREE